MGILTKIRQSSEGQKKVFSLVSAIILTLVIVVVWFSFTNKSTNSEVVQDEQNKLSSVSPWQVIKDEFSKAFSGFNETENNSSSTLSSSTIPIEIISATTTN